MLPLYKPLYSRFIKKTNQVICVINKFNLIMKPNQTKTLWRTKKFVGIVAISVLLKMACKQAFYLSIKYKYLKILQKHLKTFNPTTLPYLKIKNP